MIYSKNPYTHSIAFVVFLPMKLMTLTANITSWFVSFFSWFGNSGKCSTCIIVTNNQFKDYWPCVVTSAEYCRNIASNWKKLDGFNRDYKSGWISICLYINNFWTSVHTTEIIWLSGIHLQYDCASETNKTFIHYRGDTLHFTALIF